MDELVAQVERRHDGQLLGVLYRNGRRVQARPVGSAREGRRRAYDLLCSAVDVAPVTSSVARIICRSADQGGGYGTARG